MDHAGRQIRRPLADDLIEVPARLLSKPDHHLVCPVPACAPELEPAFRRKRVGASQREVGGGQVHFGQRLARVSPRLVRERFSDDLAGNDPDHPRGLTKVTLTR